MSARFEYQLLRGGKAAFGKIAHDFTMKRNGFSRKLGKFFVIDIIHIIAAGGEGDVHIGFGLFYLCTVAGIEELQVGSAHCIAPYMVQYVDKYLVGLTVDGLQFNGHEVYLSEYSCREEIRGRIETVQYVPFVPFHYGFQLEYIAHQQDLFSAERLPEVA